jgi:hypothetical protein
VRVTEADIDQQVLAVSVHGSQVTSVIVVIGQVSVWPERRIFLRYLAWTGCRCRRKPSSREPLPMSALISSSCMPPLPNCTRGLPNYNPNRPKTRRIPPYRPRPNTLMPSLFTTRRNRHAAPAVRR